MKLSVRVTPRASKARHVWKDGVIKIYVTAPPVDGQANVAVQEYVAETFGIPLRDIHIVSGHTSRNKIIEIIRPSERLVQEARQQMALL